MANFEIFFLPLQKEVLLKKQKKMPALSLHLYLVEEKTACAALCGRAEGRAKAEDNLKM